MFSRALLAIGTVVFLSLASPPPASASPEASVIPLLCGNVSGTGFETKFGLITAAHVATGCMSAETLSGKYLNLKWMDVSPTGGGMTSDLAAFAPDRALRPLRVNASLPFPREKLKVIGRSLLLGPRDVSVRVRSLATPVAVSGGGTREIVPDAIVATIVRGQIVPGDSGSPVLDPQGRVVGILFAERSGGRTAFITPTGDLLNEVARRGR